MIDARFEQHPEYMLPAYVPEDIFDQIFLESHDLLNAIGEKEQYQLDVASITNIVSDILRIYDIYELYKENLAGLVVMYASWVILESLSREGRISYKKADFEMLFDNEALQEELVAHQEAFRHAIGTEVIVKK